MSVERLVLDSGRYELSGRLGGGWFGEVHKGWDNHQDMEVAVKLLRADTDLEAVLQESKVLSSVRKHERVVSIHNVVVRPPRPFIVMEYLPNGSVADRLEEGDVGIVDAVRWAEDALAGLAFVHSLGIIHRDVKPANILLDASQRAVLSDFGISEDTVKGRLASKKVYVPHAAPEVRTKGTSKASDIWAMGCTLYRMLTGTYPFTKLEDATSGKLFDPHLLNPQVPLSLTRVVRQALAVDPLSRFAEADEMFAALTRCSIVNSWSLVKSTDVEEEWICYAETATYHLRMEPLKRGGYEIVLKKDLGKGPRKSFRKRFESVAKARQARRQLLVAVTQGEKRR